MPKIVQLIREKLKFESRPGFLLAALKGPVRKKSMRPKF